MALPFDLTKAKDEEIEEIYTVKGFDGIWSLTTKISILALNANGLPLYLNYLWVVTPQNFKCPICQRSKPQLMEKTKSKIIAHLSLDHDHIVDYINEQAGLLALNTSLKPLYDAFMSFKPTIICNTCNAIDSIVKIKNADIDAFFTFRPDQKSQLFKPYRRTMHWINLKKANWLWHSLQDEFNSKKIQIPTVLHDYVGEIKNTFGYKRYIEEEKKTEFYQKSPFQLPDSFQNFIQRSICNGEIVTI